MLLGALASVIESKRVSNAINLFSMAAILSSFIGVGLGVFDYLADLFRFDNRPRRPCQSWGVTFLPPLLLSLLFPSASWWPSVMPGPRRPSGPASFLPCWRRSPGKLAPDEAGFKAPGGQPMVVAVIVFGVLTAIFHLMAMAGMLPVSTG